MRRPAPRLALALTIALALVLALALGPDARPAPESLRAGRDPRTGERVVRPRPTLPERSWEMRPGPESTAPLPVDLALDHSYPERVLEEIRLHQENAALATTVLPTTQSYDRGNIAVIEDDGTILVPVGANVRIDPPALTRKFLSIHNDEYDEICVFAASSITNLSLGGGFAYELNVRNDVDGIGLDTFDYTPSFGSAGTLVSFQNFNRLSVYPEDPNSAAVASNSGLDVIEHETGHRFAAYTTFLDGDTASYAMLGRDDQHWGFFFNSLASELEGNQWRDNGDGTFTTTQATTRWCFLDEYLFGLRDSSEVDTLWYVENPSNFVPPSPYTRKSAPETGVTATGTRRAVDISQITAVNGLRAPGPLTSPKTFRIAFILLVRNGAAPTSADLAKIDLYRSMFTPHFAAAVHGLASMDSHLNSVAGSVAIAHVPLKDTEDTVSPRAVQADMSIAQKSRLIGFDGTSTRLHYRINPGAYTAVTMAPLGGMTYAAAIPAQPNGTGVDYYLTAASDSAGIVGALPVGAPAAAFHYFVGSDVTPPVLSHLPPPDPSVAQLPIAVRVHASDNLGLDSVAVTWQKTGGPPLTTAVAATGDGAYAFPIGVGAAYGDVITYRFSAVDRAAARNRAQAPTTSAPYALLVGNNYAESFEQGDGGYTHAALTVGHGDAWHIEPGAGHTPGGSDAWKCGSVGPGTYPSNLDAGLVSAPFLVTPAAQLRFWHSYSAETDNTPTDAFDGGVVDLSLDNGGTWSRITPSGGYPRVLLAGAGDPLPEGTPVYSGSSGGFVQATFDLSAYAGQMARARWRFVSDSFVELYGWTIDDVTVTGSGGVPVAVPALPGEAFALGRPVPNPGVTRASLSYRLPAPQDVRLALYDVRGRLARELAEGPRAAGAYAADWDGRLADGSQAPAGLYFVRLTGSLSGSRTGRLV
ncbi:MAG: FlgD immunoglobulin-like domain containing protein, partial [Candidatus Eisenbacteria bacterium]